MTYNTGTVNNANPGPTLYTALEVELLTAGFTLVDTVVISTRTHKILKSDSSLNSLGKTWYLDVSYPTTGAGSMLMSPFEDFNASTDQGFRGPYSANSTTIDATTYSRYGAIGSALETNWANSAGYAELDIPLSTASFGWWMSATTDRVIMMTTVSALELHYVGFFEPTADHVAAAGAAMYPLIVAHFGAASSQPASNASGAAATAALTRAPMMTTLNWQTHVVVPTAYVQLGGFVGSGGNFVATGKTNMADVPVCLGSASLGANVPSTSTGGLGLVGHLIDVAHTWTDGSITRGDTLTDTNSDTWVGVTDDSRLGLWFKAV